MSFIALDIAGGRFAKGCRMMGGFLHALPDDAGDFLFSANVAVENMEFRPAPRATGLFSHYPHQLS